MGAREGDIVVAAAILLDGRGRMLVVRKRGTKAFMQPGGKSEDGESFGETLRREVREEVGITLTPEALTQHGIFCAPAANEAGMSVVAHVFSASLEGQAITCAAEIEEYAWVDLLDEPDLPLAALTKDHLLPLARSLARGPR